MTSPADVRLAALRVVVASYVAVWSAVRAPHMLDALDFDARRLDPVGPLAWLEGPLPAGVVIVAVLATPLLAVGVALGWRFRFTAPALASTFLLVTTYRNSWGQIFHTENLVSIHLIVLAVSPADRHFVPGRFRVRLRGHSGTGAAAVQAMAVATVLTYLVAGIAKLRISGWAWVDGDVVLNQVAFDNARKQILGDTSSPFAALFVENSWLAGPAAWGSMIVELGAPLALLGRRIGHVWAGAAWAFHVAILALMAILFPYHLLGVALAPLLPVERAVTAAGRLGGSVARLRHRRGDGRAIVPDPTRRAARSVAGDPGRERGRG